MPECQHHCFTPPDQEEGLAEGGVGRGDEVEQQPHHALQAPDAAADVIETAVREAEEKKRRRQRRQQAQQQRRRAKKSKKLPNLSAVEWARVEGYCKSLEPAKVATMKFQREQLTVGDCFASWEYCEQATKEIGHGAGNLVTCMEGRKSDLLATEAFAPGIFLDTRFKSLLEPDEVRVAIAFLEALWMRLNRQQAPEGPENEQVDDPEPQDNEDLLERRLREREACATVITSRTEAANISKILHNYATWKRIPKDTYILKFWESKKEMHQKLYAPSQVVLCANDSTIDSDQHVLSAARQTKGMLAEKLQLTEELQQK
ncbi:hypothetical protein FOCC_FOCC012801, partial [Frankliniella occidentalis]